MANTSTAELWQYSNMNTVAHFIHQFSSFPNEIVMKMNLELVRKLHLVDIYSTVELLCVSEVYQTSYF